ncbi:hypothetical protein LCGC14_1273670 [marine sediment metagenome]|uniref:Uncharacterized protein n=1 Tax=marine sediment metagenome TaxID=412755 RepID=A0A0F9KZ38_9ZZZZ
MTLEYKKEYDDMSIVGLITVCDRLGVDYNRGGEILDAKAIRELLGKPAKKAKAE